MTTYDEEHLRVLRHMLGIDDPRVRRAPYRDHYCAAEGEQRAKLERMRELGLVGPVSGEWTSYYQTTELGRKLALESAKKRLCTKKKRVYLMYLRASDLDPDLTFHEFLTSPDYAEARRKA